MATAPNNWELVKQLFQAACEQDVARRSAFLKERCTDDVVRSEVERLLAEYEEASGFLSNEAIGGLPIEVASASPRERLPQGVVLAGRFRIVSFIASGGMGAVYKAEDTRLHRFVAIKLMSEEIARSAQYLARFQREAQASSALNHPNICTIYDVGEHQGNAFIAMEFLDGMPLSDRIGKRALDFDILLDLAADVADGLEAAHAAEIIHRDIKPSNIFVTNRGRAKILDFGIAKVPISRRVASEANKSTQTASRNDAHLTASGSAVGTIAYMSPEQVRAKELDTRSDLFSFGAVFYEMATGVPPFRGESPGLIFKAILDETPTSALHLNPDLPIEVERIINKCLEKDRDLRYQHASDVRTDLLRLKRRDEESTRISSVTAPSAERVLQAAAPKESAVGRSAEVVAMVKEATSRGLRQYLDDESIASITSEDVRERPFLLDFPTDDQGRPREAEVSLRLVSPDFEPTVQIKKLHIPTSGDSMLCTFLIRPIVVGDLVANLELLKGEEVIVSRPIRTRALTENAWVRGGLNIIAIPLKMLVHPALAPFVISLDASLPKESVLNAAATWDPTSPKAAAPPIEAPKETVGEFTTLFGQTTPPPPTAAPSKASEPSFTGLFRDSEAPQPTLNSPPQMQGGVVPPAQPLPVVPPISAAPLPDPVFVAPTSTPVVTPIPSTPAIPPSLRVPAEKPVPGGRSVKLGLGFTLAIIAVIGVFFATFRVGPRSVNSRSGEPLPNQGGSRVTSRTEMTPPRSTAPPLVLRAPKQFSSRPLPAPTVNASPDGFMRRAAAASDDGYCSEFIDIAKRYPFDPNSKLDAPLDQLHSLIGPTGSAWMRLNAAISPFVLKVGSRYVPNPSAPVTLSANFLLFLNRVQGLSEVVYPPDSETPHLTYTLRRLPINMERVEVTIGNEIMTAEDEQKTFVWTGAPEEVLVKNKAGDTLVSFSGSWAAFRFMSSATQLGKGKLEWANEKKATIVPDGGKEPYYFQLEVGGSVNPFFDMLGLKCIRPSANR